MTPNEIARQLFLDALEAHHPSKLINEVVSVETNAVRVAGESREIVSEDAVYIIAVGKASRSMAASLRSKLGVSVSNVCCITPDEDADEPYCFRSSHPIPDEKSTEAAQKVIHFIEKIPARSLVFFSLSGGASALICKPVDGIVLDDINTINRMLLESGATIKEINSVRKHLSAIKGGQLLSYFNPGCSLIDLVISDVPSDNLEIIGSGPTTPDSSVFEDAHETLLRFDLWEKAAPAVRDYIKRGLKGEVPETIKPGDDPLQSHSSYIIGSASIFARNLAAEADEKGFKSWVAGNAYNQPVGEVADLVIEKISGEKKYTNEPLALIFYGESTVKVTGKGKGGRNQELALRGALKIDGMRGVTWLSAGTDGIDGPTDAAGAIVDGATISRAKEKGLDAESFILNNDSYRFHEQMGTLLKTGATGNNVMDVVVILITPN